MRLPTPLSRRNPHQFKNDFGHLLVIAGSPTMLGAAALTSLAAMRAGAGLVTAAIPKALNLTLQRKLSPVIMTLPFARFKDIQKGWTKFQAVAMGPGLGQSPSTQRLVLNVVKEFEGPMVIDADALNALSKHPEILLKAKGTRVLTPHPGEMSRLSGLKIQEIEKNRRDVATNFAHTYNCTLLLKGRHTIVVSPQGKIYTNTTGNVGLAKAGSGDVLTGILGALLAQGLDPFNAAKYAAYYHGQAADQAIKSKPKATLIATDLLDYLYKK